MRLLWLIPFIFSSPSPFFRKRYFSKEGEKETFGRFYRNEVKKEGESMKDIYIYIKVGSLSAYRFVDQPIERPSFLRAYTCRIRVSVFIHGATTMIQEFIHKSRVYLWYRGRGKEKKVARRSRYNTNFMDGSVYRVSLFRILFKPDLKGRLKL